MADKIVIEAEVKSNIGEVSKDASNAASEFKIMGVSLNGVKAGFASAAVTAKGMFGSIKAGLISTGIGAFLVAIGSLVAYFTSTKEGADKLDRAFKAIGATMDVLKDRLSDVGEAISLVFQGKWSEAADKLKESVTGIVAEVVKEVKVMDALEIRLQKLRDAELAFTVQKAKTRQEIEKARLNAEDETKSAAERLEALKTALALEEQTTNRELELAREKLAIQDEQMKTSKNLVEDEAKLAQFRVELIEKETASVKMRRRVVTEVNALEREILAEQKARVKELEDIEKEKQDIIDTAFDAKIKANDEWNKKQIADAKIVADAKIKEEERVAKAKEDLAKLVEDTKQKTIAMGFASAQSLAKEGSAAAKAIGVAETIYNTQAAIMQAMKLPPPYNMIQAGMTGVMGAAAVAKILSTNPESGGGGGGGGASAASGGTPAPQMMSGAFDLTGGVAPEPVQAFVLTDSMTNSQNQLANIRRRATI